MDFDAGAKATQWIERTVLSTSGARTTGYPCASKIESNAGRREGRREEKEEL